MVLSVNSNQSALAVLAALNNTNEQLAATQTQVASGLKIGAAKDNPAVYATAQQQRADISALSTVSDGLSRAQSISDVAVSAGQTISDLLNQIKAKVLSATDPTQDPASLASLNTDYKSLLNQVQQAISGASFEGANLLDGSQANGMKFMATADATGFVTLSTQNLSLGGSIITVGSTSSIGTLTAATAMLTQVDNSIANVNAAVATLGAQSNQISAHSSFVSKLSDTLTTGVGNLVDADEAAESARLTALQVQQQLGAQSLSIANNQPSLILTLLQRGS
jgi:flagellin